jgi:drug/metabolite transporter, DME family
MAGVAWAAVAGIGFGLFQSVNRAALRGMDAIASTFLQLLVSAVVLVAASLATDDPRRLLAAPASALLSFAAAGLVHFSVGWTLLNLSQQRLGAARTSPLLATVPLFGVVLAALTLHELPSVPELAGVALIVGGVYAVELDRSGRRRRAGRLRWTGRRRRAGPGGRVAVAADRRGRPAPTPPGLAGPPSGPAAAWTASLFGLGTALCWAVSPILIRQGLRGLPSPLLGVTIGLVAATAAYGLALPLRRRRLRVAREALAWKLAAGLLVGVSTWTRWYAVALAPVAVVLALGLLSVPTVLAAAPLLVGRRAERVTAPVLAGAALVVAGALVIGAAS